MRKNSWASEEIKFLDDEIQYRDTVSEALQATAEHTGRSVAAVRNFYYKREKKQSIPAKQESPLKQSFLAIENHFEMQEIRLIGLEKELEKIRAERDHYKAEYESLMRLLVKAKEMVSPPPTKVRVDRDGIVECI